jgi:HK97 family phage portal protein
MRWKPNRYMTAFQFFRTIIGHVLLEGNAYAYIDRFGDGSPAEILPLLPDRTAPLRVGGELLYRTAVGEKTRTLPAQDVLHFRGYSYDGIVGYNVIERAKQSLGWTVAMRKYSAKFFANGSRASGVLMTPGRMSGPAAKNLLESFERETAGLDKVAKTILLEEGAKYVPTTITQEEAQFLESIQASLIDVANWLGLAPDKVGHPGRTAYAALEQSSQQHLDEAIDPHAVAIEQECRDKLLSEREKEEESHFFEFNRNALVRVDFATRQSGIKTQIDSGQLNPDEARALNNMGPRPDGQGSRYWMPSNMQYADADGAGVPKAAGRKKRKKVQGSGFRVQVAVQRVLAQAATRTVRWLAGKSLSASKSPKKFATWLDQLSDEARLRVVVELSPAIHACCAGRAEAAVDATERAAAAVTEDLRHKLLDLSGNVTAEHLAARVRAFLETWEPLAPALIFDAIHPKQAAA